MFFYTRLHFPYNHVMHLRKNYKQKKVEKAEDNIKEQTHFYFFGGEGRMPMYLQMMLNMTSSAPPPIDSNLMSR